MDKSSRKRKLPRHRPEGERKSLGLKAAQCDCLRVWQQKRLGGKLRGQKAVIRVWTFSLENGSHQAREFLTKFRV